MKPLPLIVAGFVAFTAGAILRDCAPGAANGFPVEWCGPATQAFDGVSPHIHCAGCSLLEVGALLFALGAASAAARLLRRAQTAMETLPRYTSYPPANRFTPGHRRSAGA